SCCPTRAPGSSRIRACGLWSQPAVATAVFWSGPLCAVLTGDGPHTKLRASLPWQPENERNPQASLLRSSNKTDVRELVSIDFMTVPTANFHVLYVLAARARMFLNPIDLYHLSLDSLQTDCDNFVTIVDENRPISAY